jgi:transposase
MRLPLPAVYLMEATGVYYEQLAWYLHSQKCSLSVVLPNKAKKYKESLGLKSKTDRIDAKGLSQMACEQQCTPWQPLSDNIYTLRLVTRQIQTLNEQSTVLSSQLHALQHGMFRDKDIEKMIQKQLALLEKNKTLLKTKVQQIINSDSILKQKFERIGKIKGLGYQSLAVIVAETNGFAAFQSLAQLVSYAGYDVVANDSGKRKGKTKISKKGNSRIRRCLHFPAFNMIKYEVGIFKNLYQRVYEKSKLKMKAYTAVQKKLLTIIYTLWKNNQEFVDKTDQKSGDAEQAPSLAAAPQELKKLALVKSRAKQDRHPSTHRRMPSLA